MYFYFYVGKVELKKKIWIIFFFVMDLDIIRNVQTKTSLKLNISVLSIKKNYKNIYQFNNYYVLSLNKNWI